MKANDRALVIAVLSSLGALGVASVQSYFCRPLHEFFALIFWGGTVIYECRLIPLLKLVRLRGHIVRVLCVVFSMIFVVGVVANGMVIICITCVT